MKPFPYTPLSGKRISLASLLSRLKAWSVKDQDASRPVGRRATIRKIAEEAGVSITTVSRVLNQPELVAEDTREFVQEIIRRRHFVSHRAAMSMVSNRSWSIGLIIPTITNSIYASSTQAIQQAAQEAGYSVLLGVTDFDSAVEERLIRQLLGRRVDGLILTGGSRPRDIYQLIEHNEVPYVLTWKLTDEADCPCVSFDNYHAGQLAMAHLQSLGHRRIGLVCGRSQVNDRAHERRRAYEDALLAQGIAVDPELIYERDFELVEGAAATHRMLDLSDPPTAIFCANDIQAIGAIAACVDAKRRIPEDISIIGFDDLPIAQFMRPKLTTVRVPAKRMGHLAATRLIHWIKHQERPQSEALPVELIVRETTGPANRASHSG